LRISLTGQPSQIRALKKATLIIALFALSFTACKESKSIEPTPPAKMSSANNTLTVDLLIHSGLPADFHYSYAEGEGRVKSGQPTTLKVPAGINITLSADGAVFYVDGEQLASNTFTVHSSCGITAVFGNN
jgi:hypothetical protein